MKLLLFYAFPQEVREIVRIIIPKKKIDGLPFRAVLLSHPLHEVIMVETGLGVDNAERVFLRIIEEGSAEVVISLGFCGALDAHARLGDVICASKSCLAHEGKLESLSLPDNLDLIGKISPDVSLRPGTFITMKKWERKQDLSTLLTPEMTLPVCDMETYPLARLCESNGISFIAIRAVSDEAHQDLPFDPGSVCGENGIYSPARALSFLLRRPDHLVHSIGLFRNSRIASRSLGRAVSALLHVL